MLSCRIDVQIIELFATCASFTTALTTRPLSLFRATNFRDARWVDNRIDLRFRIQFVESAPFSSQMRDSWFENYFTFGNAIHIYPQCPAGSLVWWDYTSKTTALSVYDARQKKNTSTYLWDIEKTLPRAASPCEVCVVKIVNLLCWVVLSEEYQAPQLKVYTKNFGSTARDTLIESPVSCVCARAVLPRYWVVRRSE